MFPDLRSFLPSVLRTVVPLVVGYFAAWPVAGWFNLQDDQVTSLVTILVTAAYYLLVRLAETYVEPNIGWLLGWAGRPVYPLPADVSAGRDASGDVARVVKRGDDGGQVTSDLVFVLIALALLVAIFLKVYGVV
jgi:hypothetical protein